jgi:tetratricopeptide (TPR) repeat protein
MGTFEARLRSNARLRWLVPAAAGGVVILAVAGWLLLSSGVDPAAQRKHAEAMALVAQDDMASLEKAGQTFDELSRQRTGLETVVADRALAQLLLATGLVEDVSGPAERLARKVAERDRMAALQPAPEGLAALTAEVEGLRGQVEPRQAKARALSEQAYAALKQVSGERGGEVAVARALAIYFASIGDREQSLRFIRAAPGAADRDPWIRLAEAWLDVREEGKEPRERGVSKLTTLVGNHPEIVRARYLLARTQALLGRREQAAATLDGLLAANPGHQRARRFREELVVPTAPQPAPGAPAIAPRPFLPRAPVAPIPPGAAPVVPAPQLPAAASAPAGAVPRAPLPAAVPQHVPVPAAAGQATPAAPPRPVAPAPVAAPPAKPVGPAPVGPAPARPKPAGTVPPPVVAPAQPPAPAAPATPPAAPPATP